MGRQIRVIPFGNLGNQMFQYMLARAFKEYVPAATIVGVHMADWALDSRVDEAPRGRLSIGLHAHKIPFNGVAELLRTERSVDLLIHGLGCRLDYWEGLIDVFRQDFPSPPEVSGGQEGELVINVRSSEIVRSKRGGPRHRNYIPVPLDVYERLITKTGLTPVFVGQLGANIYTDALKHRFAGARFLSHDTTLGDFHFLRKSTHVVSSVSTYAWLATWLSETAESVYLPVVGVFNPAARTDINLLPAHDRRYHMLWSDMREWTGSDQEIDDILNKPASDFGFRLR